MYGNEPVLRCEGEFVSMIVLLVAFSVCSYIRTSFHHWYP